MGMYIEKNQYLVSHDNNLEENDPALVDHTTIYIDDIPQLIHPSIHEMMLLTQNTITMDRELFWFILMMSICFSGIAGIIRMVYVIKK
jgi:hypothetical protein|uniref:Uncharacterized protein n=1 Tax=viral metagenome TaxID=1070528 RepID=A0A6C0LTN8_9ZZZZ